MSMSIGPISGKIFNILFTVNTFLQRIGCIHLSISKLTLCYYMWVRYLNYFSHFRLSRAEAILIVAQLLAFIFSPIFGTLCPAKIEEIGNPTPEAFPICNVSQEKSLYLYIPKENLKDIYLNIFCSYENAITLFHLMAIRVLHLSALILHHLFCLPNALHCRQNSQRMYS